MKNLSSELKLWLKENNYNENDLNQAGKYGNSAVMKAAREGKINL